MYISTTGEDWSVVNDPAFLDSRVETVAAINGVFAAFGESTTDYSGVAWISHDGRTWQRSSDANAAHIANVRMPCCLNDSGISTIGDYIYAFVTTSPAIDASGVDGVEVWRSADGMAWQRSAELAGSRGVLIDGVARNDNGILAVSGAKPAVSWYSTDGETWTRTANVPSLIARTEYFALGAAGSAFVITTGLYPHGTGIFNADAVTGQTWTTDNGTVWGHQADDEWGKDIIQLFAIDSTLVGIGRDYRADYLPHGAVWIAPFPDLSR